MKMIGTLLMIAGICLFLAYDLSIFGLMPRIVADKFPSSDYSLFGVLIFGVTQIAVGAVFRRFDYILQTALDFAHSAVNDTQVNDGSSTSH